MLQKHFEKLLFENFFFEYTTTQQVAANKFITFFFRNREENLFLLKGYAGTGKTTLIAAIVNTLITLKYKVVLLAPTGRAAKVFSSYSEKPAFTIHKKIYRQKKAQEGGVGLFSLGFNTDSNTLYFVDEASMIGNISGDTNFGSGALLDDLFEYVYNGRGNRLVMIGDVAQLPPVGTTLSPALDEEYLANHYDIEVYESLLTDIVRQVELSGILYNATQIRELLEGGTLKKLQLKITSFPDIERIVGGELIEALEDSYSNYGVDETIVICRSNRQANRYNFGIRSRIFYREESFTTGDKVMIVKNNYYWGEEYEKIDFIANGDMATVNRIGRYKDIYGFHFVNVRIEIYGYEEEITAWVMLDTLTTEQPALGYEDQKRLYAAIEEDYSHITSRQKRYKEIQKSEYFNALQIKFAYAITGHKSQGGEWDVVFIDPGWIRDEDMLDDEYWRWLYTAFTRARKKLYLINFKDEWFSNKSEIEN